jgi:hypothetical protein
LSITLIILGLILNGKRVSFFKAEEEEEEYLFVSY